MGTVAVIIILIHSNEIFHHAIKAVLLFCRHGITHQHHGIHDSSTSCFVI